MTGTLTWPFAPSISIDVAGLPGAQGSKRHVGRGIMVESSRKVKPWRSDVKDAAEKALIASDEWDRMHPDPVAVTVAFLFVRPKSHYRTGRNAHLLRDNASKVPSSRAHGDVDKLVRSTLDALVAAGVIADDSIVTELHARKIWARPGEMSGARIVITADPQEI